MFQLPRPRNPILVAILAAASASPALDLRVMSFNVQQPWGTNWDGRKASAATLVNRESPDVMGTQEATKHQLDDLQSGCPGYERYGLGRDGGDAGESSAIFWKSARFRMDPERSGNVWLSSTPTTPSRYGGSYNRIATYVRLVDKQTNEGFSLFNIHNYMPAESDYRMRAAKQLVQTVVAKANANEPVFLTGDFNSTEGDAVTIWMKSGSDNPMRFRDTYREVDPNGSVTTGFGTKFDYIYVPDASRTKTLRSYVPKDPVASDHYPIVADLVVTSSTSARPTRPQRIAQTGSPRIEVTRSLLTAQSRSGVPLDRVEVYDLRGTLVANSSEIDLLHHLDVSSMPKGTHILRIHAESIVSSQTFVVP